MKKLIERFKAWLKARRDQHDFDMGYALAKRYDYLNDGDGSHLTMKVIRIHKASGQGDHPYVLGMEQYLADVMEDV